MDDGEQHGSLIERTSTSDCRVSTSCDARAPERKGRPIDVDTIEALEELLIMADVGVAATDRIIAAVKQQTVGKGPARRGEG